MDEMLWFLQHWLCRTIALAKQSRLTFDGIGHPKRARQSPDEFLPTNASVAGQVKLGGHHGQLS
jgi:hypothetical protein